MVKLNFQYQSSVSHDSSEVILIFWLAAKKHLLLLSCWKQLVMAKWSVLNQWSFQPNCNGKRFITRSFLKRSCCGHLVVMKMNNTFQSAVIHYSCWFHIWFYYWFLVFIYCTNIMAIIKVIHLCRCNVRCFRFFIQASKPRCRTSHH